MCQSMYKSSLGEGISIIKSSMGISIACTLYSTFTLNFPNIAFKNEHDSWKKWKHLDIVDDFMTEIHNFLSWPGH